MAYFIIFIMAIAGVAIYSFVMRDVSNPDQLLTEDQLIEKYDITPRQAHNMRRGMKFDERDHAKTKASAVRTGNQIARTVMRAAKKLK